VCPNEVVTKPFDLDRVITLVAAYVHTRRRPFSGAVNQPTGPTDWPPKPRSPRSPSRAATARRACLLTGRLEAVGRPVWRSGGRWAGWCAIR